MPDKTLEERVTHLEEENRMLRKFLRRFVWYSPEKAEPRENIKEEKE